MAVGLNVFEISWEFLKYLHLVKDLKGPFFQHCQHMKLAPPRSFCLVDQPCSRSSGRGSLATPSNPWRCHPGSGRERHDYPFATGCQKFHVVLREPEWHASSQGFSMKRGILLQRILHRVWICKGLDPAIRPFWVSSDREFLHSWRPEHDGALQFLLNNYIIL